MPAPLAAPLIVSVGARVVGVAAYARVAPLFGYFFGIYPSMYLHEWITTKELKAGADPKELAQRWWQMNSLGQLRYRKHTLDKEQGAEDAVKWARAYAEERRVMPSYQGIPNSAAAAGITPDEHYEKAIDINAVAEIVFKDEKVKQEAAAKAMEEWVRQRRGEQGTKEFQGRGPAPSVPVEPAPPEPAHVDAARNIGERVGRRIGEFLAR